MHIGLRIPRPDYVNLGRQGHRGPFAPLIITLESMTKINEWLIGQGGIPPIYGSGVVYQTEPPNVEELVTCDVVVDRMWGDCGHLAPWLTAQRRHEGFGAKCCIKWKWVGDIMLVHVLTQYDDGSIEDPSKILGMKGEYE